MNKALFILLAASIVTSSHSMVRRAPEQRMQARKRRIQHHLQTQKLQFVTNLCGQPYNAILTQRAPSSTNQARWFTTKKDELFSQANTSAVLKLTQLAQQQEGMLKKLKKTLPHLIVFSEQQGIQAANLAAHPRSGARFLEAVLRTNTCRRTYQESFDTLENINKQEQQILQSIGTPTGVLTEAETKVNTHDEDGKTVLMSAAQSTHVGADILQLLNEEAKPNTQDKHGKTALIYAVEAGNLEAVKALLAFEAQVDLADKEKLTPLRYAIASMEPSPRIVEELLQADAQPDAPDERGNTPLIHAVKKCINYPYPQCKRIVHLLLNAGANPRHKNLRDESAFSLLEKMPGTEFNHIIARIQKTQLLQKDINVTGY